MPGLQFESLTESLRRLPQVIQSIPDIVRNPAANLQQAAILLSMFVLLSLVVLLSIILAMLRPDVGEDELLGDAVSGQAEREDTAGAGAPESTSARVMSWLTVTSVVILVAAGVWTAAGITTASSEVCISCHADTPHSVAAQRDPHDDVRCTSCHDSGGPIARATVDLAGRLQHVVLARAESDRAGSYGRPVSSDACLRCHRGQTQGVFVGRVRGVRMSHVEPLAAGAQCVDCHILKAGIVSATTVGMTSCLRCHDDTVAKSTCPTCHIGDPARGMSSAEATNMASALVPNPQCGSCHFDMTSCNACHGISMPHSIEFKAYAHARPAALDIWYGDGKLCAKCHYAGHNSCIRVGCHITSIQGGHPNPAWAKLHQLTSWSAGSSAACSCHQWNPWDHNGMIYCQICHPVKPKNTIP
ncbi:MAG: hypothetical protein WCJ13_08870 [Coriobacteriia bacterium]